VGEAQLVWRAHTTLLAPCLSAERMVLVVADRNLDALAVAGRSHVAVVVADRSLDSLAASNSLASASLAAPAGAETFVRLDDVDRTGSRHRYFAGSQAIAHGKTSAVYTS